ncbi:MAG TPA: glycosyltransferase family 4 protein [Mycobacteriales bacterium]|nr:glycosyltransferase family 4 protein [Mycobacteriales bacterium]
MMKRALLVHPSDEWYGADQMLHRWAEVLMSMGVDVTVAVPCDVDYPGTLSTRLREIGVEVQTLDLPILRRRYATPVGLARLAGRGRRSLARIRAVARGADLVVFSTVSVLPVAAATVGRGRVRAIHIQEFLEAGAERWTVSAAISGLVDDIVCCSSAVRAGLRGGAASRAIVVHNGIADLSPEPDADDVDDSPCSLLVVGRIQRWKGQDRAIRILAEPALRDHPAAPVLRLVGGEPPGESGRYVPALRALARECGVADRVEFVGERPDVARFFRDATVVLNVATRPDPFPLTGLEAMRAGKAIVASPTGGLPEMLGDAGRFATTTAAAAGEVAALLDDPLERERLGAAARSRWEQHFTERHHRARLAELFDVWLDGTADGAGPRP